MSLLTERNIEVRDLNGIIDQDVISTAAVAAAARSDPEELICFFFRR